jgi:hypothetical protein
MLSEGGDNYKTIQASGICVRGLQILVPVTMLSGTVSMYNHFKSLCPVVIQVK